MPKAAEAGDAGKVDKRRKKQKADAAEADLFADGGEVGGDDDVEYDGEDNARSRLAGTGANPKGVTCFRTTGRHWCNKESLGPSGCHDAHICRF